jgi:cellulose synthase/poly-beta-1,6-N-acetylglucosamine synthase-like glycosyltransferase
MLPSNAPIKVSVLLAARNEEKNILRCLHALHSLHYPSDQIEICIGDDHSTDQTAALIQDFCKGKPSFRFFQIKTSTSHLQGKTNALAQLAHHARGEYFFYCDADIAVHRDWIGSMLQLFEPKTGVVVGITRMRKGNWLANMLSIEWLLILTLLRICRIFKIPVTALGNNMAVTREAYFKVGGYEQMKFSIVEDYALFMEIIQHGYDFEMGYQPKLISESEPVENFNELNLQRRRWMKGVKESGWLVQTAIIATSSIVPITLLLFPFHVSFALQILIIHYILITLLSCGAIVALKQFDLLKSVLAFWFYFSMYYTCMIYLYFNSSKITWKGRTYA